ncbi:MAG: Sua5/YciO/YrdC/YwlC family protein, partial [Clostridia bacterium]|nr:Sua5/YciO/YrdC/YwlC family protein [Clostridia bacterium]
MRTTYIKIDPSLPDESVLKEAADCIKRGGLVAFPTETVYGLGADSFNGDAVKKIYIAKGRPSDNPLISHIASVDDVTRLAREVP